MENLKKDGFMKTFSIWFGIGALMFGTYCGANMASGVYASAYIVTLGGGWALAWLGMFFAFMTFFCAVSLVFIRIYKVKNYNQYYLALYGLHKPDSNPVLRGGVTVFFDIFTMLKGLVNVAATVALFTELMNALLGIPTLLGSAMGILLFAVLTIYGASFLRKFNSIMTISLVLCLAVILIAVISIRGDVLASRVGNFQVGLDWTDTTVKAHFLMFLSYCFNTSAWGSTLSNYSEQIRDNRDAIGSGIMIGVLVTALFAITGAIVLPFMPEAMKGTPILMICQNYLPGVLTAVYWVVVIFAVASTAPSFTFNFSNRWAGVWKTEKISHKAKFFILSLGFLLACGILSQVGLMVIVKKGYTLLGNIALFAVIIPIFISIPRMLKQDKADRIAAGKN
ncbi:MAG: hypothetical protein HFE83_06515 [Lachnospiraceae bacterium]|nr:hypothetical protein [Lachnospiraceae bacterium]